MISICRDSGAPGWFSDATWKWRACLAHNALIRSPQPQTTTERMQAPQTVQATTAGGVLTIAINRPNKRNCVDGPTAAQLAAAFRAFEADDSLHSAVLTGAGDHFCAGADLAAVADGENANAIAADGDGPMGPTRMRVSKPVIAAVSGYCVAGGLELAAWCDLRVADDTAVFGVFCRRFGVPLIDGGTVRLPRLIGASHAMDMILTGRPVEAAEAQAMGLVNRLVPAGQALQAAQSLAEELGQFPQTCMRGDMLSAHRQWSLSESDAIAEEFAAGLRTLQSGETVQGARRFTQGQGRHGRF